MKQNLIHEKKSSGNWHEQVYNNPDLWDKKSIEYLPGILAHEYLRLRELFRNGQTYGAFLQTKDVLELFIKVPVIIAVADIVNNKPGLAKRTDAYGVLYDMLKDTLSLGHWIKIAGKVLEVTPEDSVTHKLLNDIHAVCSKDKPEEGCVDFAKWRNSRIGHGALMFDENEQFKDEMTLLLKLIKNHLSRSVEYYAELELVAHGENESVLLTNNQRPELSSDMRLFARVDNSEYFSLAPFMEIIGNKIYCFDTYLHDKKKVDMLDYFEASKIKQSIKILDDLYTDLCRNLNIKNMGKAEIGNLYSTEDERLFLSNSNDYKYLKPEYLFNFLESTLKDNESGVYLLKMTGGMGKSTFVKMLDNNSGIEKKYKKYFEDYSVRAYYINSAYSSDVNKFMFDLPDRLRKDDNGGLLSGGGRSFNDKQSFAKMLNYYRAGYAKCSEDPDNVNVKPNLIVIIDGLDEAVSAEGNSIIDFIPEPDMLDKGVHILLTCRTDEELSAAIHSKLLGLKTTRNYVVSKDDPRNIAMVTDYINKILGINDMEIVSLMNEIIDRRLLRANILRYMPEIIGQYNFLDSKEVCKVFLDKLNFIYSEKYFVKLRKILLILAMSEVPLTVHQVIKILGDVKVNFQLLGIFRDISPLLEKVETDSGPYFTIAHQDYRKLIFEYFEADGEKLQLELLQAADEIIMSARKLEFEDYLVIYFAYKYTNDLLPDLMKYIQADSFLYHTATKLEQNIDTSSDFYKNYIISEICKKIIYISSYDSIKIEGQDGEFELGVTRLTCYYVIAAVFLNTGNHNMAGVLFNSIIQGVQSEHYTEPEYLNLLEKAQIHLQNIPKEFYSDSLVEEVQEYEEDTKQPIIYDNVGRNSACPCGSGKKYKKCCMLNGPSVEVDAPYKSSLDYYLGLNIVVSQHDVLAGPREFVLAVFDSAIQYVEQKEIIDVKILSKLFIAVKSILINGYHCDQKLTAEEFYQQISYDTILNFFSNHYQMKKTYLWKLVDSFQDKDFGEEFSRCERDCLISFINSFLMDQSWGDKYEEKFSFGINFNDKQAEVLTNSAFNRAWKNDIRILYHLIKSRHLDACMGHISARIFCSQNRSVLGWKLNCCSQRDILPPFSDRLPVSFSTSLWKQVKYDYNLTYLSNSSGLKEETIEALKVLTDNKSIYHDYIGDTLAEVYITEEQEELFPPVEANYQNLINLFSTIEKEYIDIVGLLSSQQVDNVDQAYEYLFKLDRIKVKHYKVLCEFRSMAKDFSQSSIISDTITSLQKIMFNKKLVVYISDLVRREKIRKNITAICEMTTNKTSTRNIMQMQEPTYAGIEVQLNS